MQKVDKYSWKNGSFLLYFRATRAVCIPPKSIQTKFFITQKQLIDR